MVRGIYAECALARDHIPPHSPMPQTLDLPPDGGSDDAQKENNQESQHADEPQPDAFGAITRAPGDQGGQRGTDQDIPPAAPNLDLTRLTPRDRAVIRYLVLLRLLTYDQLHRLMFPSADKSIARRRIRSLARAGWLTTWEASSRHGGHTRYAHPTVAAIR